MERASALAGGHNATVSAHVSGCATFKSERQTTLASGTPRPMPWRKSWMSGSGRGSGDVCASRSRCAGSKDGASGVGARYGDGSSIFAKRRSIVSIPKSMTFPPLDGVACPSSSFQHAAIEEP